MLLNSSRLKRPAHGDLILQSGLFTESDAGDLIFVPFDSELELDAAVVAASTIVDEQATPVPIEFTLDAIFTDLDASDLHDIEINGVFLDGEVPPGTSAGDFKTEGTFFDFLSVDDVNNADPDKSLANARL